jgi:hypothetical protein
VLVLPTRLVACSGTVVVVRNSPGAIVRTAGECLRSREAAREFEVCESSNE